MTTEDPVNPKHYADLGQHSALHVVQRWGLGFCLGNALKYIQRAGRKPGANEITDLKKAVWYIRRHIHERDPREPDPASDEERAIAANHQAMLADLHPKPREEQ